jgi:hypothetical protein
VKIPMIRQFHSSLAWFSSAFFLFFMLGVTDAFAHGVAEGDRGYVQEVSGVQFLPFMYLGAKHMVTGYDHLLFLCGVIFFLYRLRDIALYVTLFAVGHSVTMLFGVLAGTAIAVPNPCLRNLLDPLLEVGLIGALATIMVTGSFRPKHAASPAYADLPCAAEIIDQLAPPIRP